MDLVQEFMQECVKHGQQPVWITPDLYYDLLERGMITFIADNQAMFWGHQLRIVTEMPVEYRFVDTTSL